MGRSPIQVRPPAAGLLHLQEETVAVRALLQPLSYRSTPPPMFCASQRPGHDSSWLCHTGD